MAIYEDPYFVTADPYGGLEGDGEELEAKETVAGEEDDAYAEADAVDDHQEVAGEEFFTYSEGEEEEVGEQEEALEFPELIDVEEFAEETAEETAEVGQAEGELYFEETTHAEDQQAEGELYFEETAHAEDQQAATSEPLLGDEEELLMDFPEAEVEPCSPGLEVHEEDVDDEEGLGFHVTGLDEVDYTPQDDGDEDQDDDKDDSDEEPAWLRNVGVLDPKVAEDADVSAAFLDGLTGSEMDLDLAYPQYVPCLARYLVGHPEALVTKKKKGHKKGSGKRYFGGEERSEDVMADKVVTGCWACGKLDHESQDCSFKRCFVCSEQGHEVSECRKRNISCRRCFKQGHLAELCPLEHYDATFENEEDMSFCRCMLCGEEGHLNCATVPRGEEFIEENAAAWHQNGHTNFNHGYVHEEQPRNDWSQESWGHHGGGWNNGWSSGWKAKDAMATAWLAMQAGMSPMPVGPVDWAPPAGDGGGYGAGDAYDHGGGNRWGRNGNNKGWGGNNRSWNGGWGRQNSWDAGWGGWDGGHPHKRRRH